MGCQIEITTSGYFSSKDFIVSIIYDVLADISKSKELFLQCNFASFNIATPRFGTKLRELALEKEWVDEEELERESAKSKPVGKNQRLTNDEIYGLQKHAIKSFYLRPSYIIKRARSIRSFFELRRTIEEAGDF